MDRTFTLSEAQAMLPVLQQLLQTAVGARTRMEEIETEFHALISRILLQGGVQIDPIQVAAIKAERERASHRLQDAVNEIAVTGVQVKDVEMGLLDFPCMLQGRMVLLCWKLGEAAIEHWHGTQEGFANRKRLDPSMFSPDGSRLVN